MKSAASPKATEERLEEIRKVALKHPGSAGVRPSAGTHKSGKVRATTGSPHSSLRSGVGGAAVFFPWRIAGLSACIGFAAQLLHGAPELIRLLPLGRIPWSRDLSRPANRRPRPASAFPEHVACVQASIRHVMGAWILVAFLGLCISRGPVSSCTGEVLRIHC